MVKPSGENQSPVKMKVFLKVQTDIYMFLSPNEPAPGHSGCVAFRFQQFQLHLFNHL